MMALIAVIFVIAGGIKGVTGIGLPTAAVGLMSQALDPRIAIAMVVFPSLLSNAWQIWRSGQMLDTIRRYAAFILCLMVMIGAMSATVTATVSTPSLLLGLGIVIILFAVINLAWRPPVLPVRHDRTAQIVAGLSAGTMGGLTGIWAPIMVPYLMMRGVEKDDFVRASGVMIFMGTLPLIWGFWTSGIITGAGAGLSVAMIIPALVGFALGEALRRHLDQERFRKVVLLIFLIMGLNLLRRAFI